MTYKLSQDHLETLFSALRSRGGYNNNPTAKQFIAAYKRVLVHADVDISKCANNILLDKTRILDVSVAISSNDECIDNLIQSPNEIHDSVENNSDHDYIFHNVWFCSDYVQDVVTYIAGFIAKSVAKIIKCQICCSSLISEEIVSCLQKRKCRGGLISASEDVITICLIAEKVFRTYSNVLHGSNITLNLIVKAMSLIPSNIFNNNNHLFDQSPLADHRSQLLKIILKKYFNLRLHHKAASRKDTIVRIRTMYHKLILFKNQ